jgi:fibronectin type 3 domain-containing protein
MLRFLSSLPVVLVWLGLCTVPAAAQTISAPPTGQFTMESATDTQPTRVELAWSPPPPEATGFNLYRSRQAGQYPGSPVNATLLQPPDDCAALQQHVPQGSDDWQALEQALAPSPQQPFDPCRVGELSRPEDSTRHTRLHLLASADLDIARGIGRAYSDTQVQQGTTYYYQLRAVNAQGTEIDTLATDVTATAGQPASVSAPTGLTGQGGESRVFLAWNPVSRVQGYHVYRAPQQSGPYRRVNQTRVTSQATQDLTGQSFSTPRPAFLDYQRFTQAGDTTTHTVNGQQVGGPLNGTQYFYKVAAANLLGTVVSPRSNTVAATPVDSTAPATPQSVSVSPNNATKELEIQWTAVSQDVDGEVEIQGVKEYRIVRYRTPNDRAGGTPIATVPHPANRTLVDTVDADPTLRSQYGEKTFHYRIRAVDAAGNESALSAAGSGYLEDVSPPSPPTGVIPEGADSSITIEWDPVSAPDRDGYVVYRSRCHYGNWVPCDQKGMDLRSEIRGADACSGPFREIGRVSQDEAAEMVDRGNKPSFKDTTMAADSPLCYAYLVKAKDSSQNESGAWPPTHTERQNIHCEQIQETVPPEPAVITGLKARANGIRLEWIGPPVQDVAAYHVYRSQKEDGTYQFVGGQTVATTSAGVKRLSNPYQPPSTPPCQRIPVESWEHMSTGHFVDSTATPNTEYWYRVVGIDQRGNQVDPDEAAPASTFTFSTETPDQPTLQSVQDASGCTIKMRWTPTFDSTVHNGFAVFRSRAQGGAYRQVSPVVQGNAFTDDGAACNVAYWYKIVALSPDGHYSPLSVPQQAQATP